MTQVRTIQVALYRGKSATSGIIRWVSWGIYSHAAVRLPEDGGIVYESWEGVGVRKCSNLSDGHTPGTRVDLFDVFVTDSEYKKIVAALESQLGKKYDLKGVLRFSPFLRLFMGKQPSAKEQIKWFCSEYAGWAFEQGGINLLLCPPWQMSPSDLAKSPLLRYSHTVYTASI